MHFDKFMRITNDYYSQRQSDDGIDRIFRLFDNNGKGFLDKDDFKRCLAEFDIEIDSEQCHLLFVRASSDGDKITFEDFAFFMKVNL